MEKHYIILNSFFFLGLFYGGQQFIKKMLNAITAKYYDYFFFGLAMGFLIGTGGGTGSLSVELE